VEHRVPDHLAVSPDGQWLAFDYATRGADRDVHLIRMDGSAHRVVMQGQGDDEVMGWSGVPAQLLVLSDRGGTPAVWALSLREGNPVGEPTLVRSDLWRSIPIGTASDGSLFYSVLVGDRGFHRVVIRPAAGTLEVSGTRLSQGESVPHFMASGWAPDGQRIAFAVQRGRTPMPMSLEEIVVRSVTGGSERRLPVRLTRTLHLQWYPDGQALLLFGVDDEDNFGLFRLDLGRGSLEPVVMTSELDGAPINLVLTPDGSRVVLTSMEWPAVRLQSVPVTGGPPSLLRRIETGVGALPRGIAMSPDGRHVALALLYFGGKEPGRIVIASLDGTPEREVHRLRSDERFAASALSWTPDGEHLLFGVVTLGPNFDMVEIRNLRLDGGIVTATGFRQAGLRAMSLSPDGTTLMYGLDQLGMELWTMDPPDFVLPSGGRP
jgi:Tol biopolymer transport system component